MRALRTVFCAVSVGLYLSWQLPGGGWVWAERCMATLTMMEEFHSPTLVCSYSVAELRAASQACVGLCELRPVERCGCHWGFAGAPLVMGTYLGGDLGQVRDRNRLEICIGLAVIIELRLRSRICAVQKLRPISQWLDVPTWVWCSRQPLYLYFDCGIGECWRERAS